MSRQTYLKATLFIWALGLNFAIALLLMIRSEGFRHSPIFLATMIAALFIAIGMSFFRFQLIFRRWHDIGRSAKWTWALLLPLVCYYFHVILFIRKGDEQDNKFGLKPLDEGSEFTFPLITSVLALLLFLPLSWTNLFSTFDPKLGILHSPKAPPTLTLTEISLQNQLKATPCDAQSAYDLSQSLLRTDHYREVIELDQSFNSQCKSPVVQLRWAAFSAAKKLHDFPLAEKIVTRLVEDFPKDSDYRAWRGMLYETQAQWEKAALDFESVVRLKPEILAIPLNLVDAYRQLDQPCKALAVHNKYGKVYRDILNDEGYQSLNAMLQEACKRASSAKT